MKKTAERIALMRAAAAGGATTSEIARAIGVSITSAMRWAAQEGIKAARMGAKGVLIPKWVPGSLHDEYLEVAAESGEEAAASFIRRLKNEMRREGIAA